MFMSGKGMSELVWETIDPESYRAAKPNLLYDLALLTLLTPDLAEMLRCE